MTSKKYKRAIDTASRRAEQRTEEKDFNGIYRRIATTTERGRRLWPLWFGGGLVAAAATSLVLLWPGSESPPSYELAIVHQSGSVRASAAAISLEAGARLDARFSDGSQLSLLGPARAKRIRGAAISLDEGIARLSVEKQRARQFELRVGRRRVVVRGTRFVVAAEQGQLTYLAVSKGVVDLYSEEGDLEKTLRGGRDDTWGTAPDRSMQEPFVPPWWKGGSGRLQVTSEPPAELSLNGEVAGDTPWMAQLPPGRYRVALRARGFTDLERMVKVSAGENALELTMQPVPVEVRKAKQKQPDDKWATAERLLRTRRCKELKARLRGDETARSVVMQAECQLRSGKKKAALKLYDRVARIEESGRLGEVAMFEAAKLVADMGGLSDGLHRMRAYLDRYPNGRFVGAAGYRICEILVRTRNLDEAEQCLSRYRKEHASSRRAGDALFLSALLTKTKKRWQEAIRLHETYLGRDDLTSQRREEASFSLLECLRASGSKNLSTKAQQFLQRYPDSEHAGNVRQWAE